MECAEYINPALYKILLTQLCAVYGILHFLVCYITSNPKECWTTCLNKVPHMHRGSVKLSDLDFVSCIPHRSPRRVPQMKAFSIFMQQPNIFKWFTTPLLILAVTSHWSSRQECSFLSKWLLHGESPPGSAPHSRDEWFISHVVNEMVFAGLCLHKTPFMFDDSEPQQISHLFQQIIVSVRAPLMWGVMSGPHRQNTWSRKKLPDSMHPKMWHAGWLIKWHVRTSLA